jgi:hypothetical protein
MPSQLGPSLEAASDASLVERAQLLLAHCCLLCFKKIDVPAYFCKAIGIAIILGSLSNLLCIRDEHIITIYQSCGFHNVKRNCFSDTSIQGFVKALKCSDQHYYNIQEPNN